MCSGRVDLSFVLRAFSNGTDGVFIGGCHLNECHYITDGNYHALSMVLICRKILSSLQINPERLRLESMSAGEGIHFAEVMNDFSRKLREMGPLGKAEGIDPDSLQFRLESATQLVPYIKLVERERLRINVRSEEEYRRFFASAEVDRLFGELVLDKLAINQILMLLRKEPRSTGELAGVLGVSPTEVTRHLNNSAKLGLARFDQNRKRYVAA
jgi:coenzyme F420-reducing hydrogenase delta subunit/DNA-binding transcriptional ArsR family regulator